MTRRPPTPEPQQSDRASLTATWFVVAATVLIVPLLFDVHGKDSFRLPKELAFRAGAIALLVVFAFWATRPNPRFRAMLRGHLHDPVVVVTLMIVAWTVTTTFTSLNPRLSADSLVTVIASAVFFFGCRAAVRRRPLLLLDVLVVAAAANATLTLLQRLGIWQPFRLPPDAVAVAIDPVGFLGNTNDVGAFLAPAAVAALIVTVVISGKRRITYSLAALLMLAGLLASFARTSITAYVIAIGAAALSSGGRLRRTALSVMAVVALLLLWPGAEIGKRYWRIADQVRRGDLGSAVSGRLPAFITAIEMFCDRPLLGTGPGTFKWLYMRYRLNLTGRYPELWLEGMFANFAEVHSDHLQVAAETGVPGYLLLLTSFGVIARSPRQSEDSPATDFAERLRLPIVVLMFVVMMAHFPLQTASARVAFLLLTAILVPQTDSTW